MASDVQNMQSTPFVKQLAANDRTTRDKAVESLRTYLSGRRNFTELELLKLWKGLFFCMWMSDRARHQQRLAVDLAGLVDVIPDENVLPFLEAFWKTMAREWTGIDVLRMDKFLLMIRTYVAASFRYLAKKGWGASTVKGYMGILSAIPLSATDMKVPNGLQYHVMDIYIDELDKVDTPRCGSLPIDLALEPLRSLKMDSSMKAVRTRAMEALEDSRLSDWNNPKEEKTEDAEDNEDAEGWNGIDD